MSKWQSVVIPSLLLGGVAALTAYGIVTLVQVRILEHRLSNTEEPLHIREYVLTTNGPFLIVPTKNVPFRTVPATNRPFLFDGVRPFDSLNGPKRWNRDR